jgi:thiol-disulfide isomerase/thioredoxin
MDTPTQPPSVICDAQKTNETAQRTRRATLFALGAAVSEVALTGSVQAGINAPMTALAPRPPAPDFTLPSVAGPTYSLKQFRGIVVLINFWATWCPPCRAEMPSIERLHQSTQNKDLQILALAQGETQSVVFAYLGQLTPSPTFPILLDQRSKVADAFHVAGIPTTFLIDKTGRIAYKAVGGRNYAASEVRSVIATLVAA